MAVHPILYGTRRLSEYAGLAEPQALAALRWLAHPLAGLRVLHLSTGRFGSPVAEMLATLVPLQRDLGIIASWQVVTGDLTRASTALRHGLMGADVLWGERELRQWCADAGDLAPS